MSNLAKYLGQVKSGKKYWADGTPVAGQQFEYAFDEIGNRTSAKTGGDAAGSSSALRSSTYTPTASIATPVAPFRVRWMCSEPPTWLLP